MAHRSPGRGARAWQVESVWVKRREGPERVLSAYRLLLDLPPRRAPREVGPLGYPLRQERRPAAAAGAAETASLTAPDDIAL
jgi:hypothetical protein